MMKSWADQLPSVDIIARPNKQPREPFLQLELSDPKEFCLRASNFVKTQCQDEFRNLSGCVIKILTAGKILQISIAWCQIEAEIHSFPTMYGKGG